MCDGMAVAVLGRSEGRKLAVMLDSRQEFTNAWPHTSRKTKQGVLLCIPRHK